MSSGNKIRESKFLSHGEVDNWVIDAEENEVIIVQLTTSQFDGVLGLAQGKSDEEKVFFSVDKEGSNSRFRHRFTQSGKYRIRVHGYQFKGGGNYQLDVERIKCKPILIGQKTSGRFDENGIASFFFDGKPGQNLVCSGSYQLRILDPSGINLPANWDKNFLIRQKGEHLVSFRGQRNSRFEFRLCPAKIESLEPGTQKETETQEDSLNIWELDGVPGQFQVIRISRSPTHKSRLISSPELTDHSKRLDRRHQQGQMINFLPTVNKGEMTTYTAFFNAHGKYQLQTLSKSSSLVRISANDPTINIKDQEKIDGRIPVGGAAYFGFRATPGDLVRFTLTSNRFDCQLGLYDSSGNRIAYNDDVGQSKNSQITHLVTGSGIYRWRISSFGNGGGGGFTGRHIEIKKQEVKIGEIKNGFINHAEPSYFRFESRPGKQVLINVQSDGFQPLVKVFDAGGHLIGNNKAGTGRNSLIPIELRDRSISIWVAGHRPELSAGKYRIRVLDVDWE